MADMVVNLVAASMTVVAGIAVVAGMVVVAGTVVDPGSETATKTVLRQ